MMIPDSLLQVRDCRLVSLLDLALEKDYVRGKVADYMNKLVNMGVAGFRVDACKHMWPGDLSAVFGRLNNLNTTWFSDGSRPFIFQEVKCIFLVVKEKNPNIIHLKLHKGRHHEHTDSTPTTTKKEYEPRLENTSYNKSNDIYMTISFQVIDLGGELISSREYFHLGRVTEFKYGAKLGTVFRKWNNEKLMYTKYVFFLFFHKFKCYQIFQKISFSIHPECFTNKSC